MSGVQIPTVLKFSHYLFHQDDEVSIAESSINGEEEEEEEEDDEERYLSEPTYNNLDPAWLRSVSKVAMPQQQAPGNVFVWLDSVATRVRPNPAVVA